MGASTGGVWLPALIGRADELSALEQLVGRPDVPVVTIVGPGGVGKSRLARELVARRTGRAVFVSLAEVADPAVVIEYVASEVPGVGADPGSRVADAFADGGLLVLDNFEHLLAAAIDVARLASTMPANASIVVTSRAPLSVAGEVVYALAPLPRAAAVELFEATAQRRSANRRGLGFDVELVGELVERLDRLPLAIELAGAMVSLLSPRAMLSRADAAMALLVDGPNDVPERHRSLRGALTWSYELLELSAQRLFRRLAVFPGGCSVSAAGAVAILPGERSFELLGTVRVLVDQCLVVVEEGPGGEPRIAMLATTRQFASELLAGDPRVGDANAAAADWLVDVVTAAGPHLQDASQAAVLAELALEVGNVRAVIGRALAGSGERTLEPALLLAARYWRVWAQRGLLSEGAGHLQSLSDAAEGDNAILASSRAEALAAGGLLAIRRSDYDGALRLLTAARAIWEHAGVTDERHLARTFDGLGWVASARGEFDDARSLLERSIELHRAMGGGDDPEAADALGRLAMAMLFAHQPTRARVALDECISVKQRSGDDWGMAFALMIKACLDVHAGETGAATAAIHDGLGHAFAIGDQLMVAYHLEALALAVAAQPGRADRAVTALSVAGALRMNLATPTPPQWTSWLAPVRDRLAGAIDATTYEAAWRTGQQLEPRDTFDFVTRVEASVVVTAREREVLALVAAGLSDADIAQRLYISVRTANAHLRSINTKLGTRSRSAAVNAARQLGLLDS